MKDSILNLVLQRLAGGYEEQVSLYQEMYGVALEQEAVLQGEEVNIDQLMELINRRQELIDTLEGHNSEIGQLKGEICLALEIEDLAISKIKERLTGPGVQALEEVMAGLAGLLSKIKELDKNNEEILRKRIKETKDKLAELQNAKRANKAYQPDKQGADGVFIDFSK